MKLEHRLLRANIIQMVAIAVATLLGVFVTAAITEQVLLRQALEGEADFYWKSLQAEPNHVLPHTLNMIGYIETLEGLPIKNPETFNPGEVHDPAHAIPDYMRGLPLGYHTHSKDGSNHLIHVSQRENQKLYLLINEEQITELSFFFGVMPLMISLAGLYLLSWLTQRLFVSTASPISYLANQLETIDINTPTQIGVPETLHYKDTEIMTLFKETQTLLDRVQSSVAREKRFSRDASHELRTPLAVMKGSLEIIEKSGEILFDDSRDAHRIQRALQRATRSAIDMERLIEELLLLAREDYQQVKPQDVNCNKLVEEVAEEMGIAFHDSQVKLEVEHIEQWSIHAPLSVLRVVLVNIASNAMRYTKDGSVTIATWDRVFQIRDTGDGFNPDFLQHAFQPFSRGHHENTKGFGLGLSIVKRFCDHYGWEVHLDSKPGEGTVFEVRLIDSNAIS